MCGGGGGGRSTFPVEHVGEGGAGVTLAYNIIDHLYEY